MTATSIPIFQSIDPPDSGADKFRAVGVSWRTWSVEVKQIFRSWKSRRLRLPEPVLIKLPKRPTYPYTYTITSFDLRSRFLQEDLLVLAESLRKSHPGSELVLLDKMFDKDFDGVKLKFLFAGLRVALVRTMGTTLGAMHVPLDSDDRGPFPLHADLFPQPVLFNVFDRVQTEAGGSSIFLSTKTLFSRLSKVQRLPASHARRMRALLNDRIVHDGFHEFYNLLHGRRHKWTVQVRNLLREARIEVKLGSGQGYMINDRRWLHGRLPVHGRVGARRLQRLLFYPDGEGPGTTPVAT